MVEIGEQMIEKFISFIKRHYREILILIFVILFLEIAENVLAKEIMERDIKGY